MTIKRLSRILICLVLVLSLLVGISPLKAHATAVGAAPVFVAMPAPVVIGAIVIGLGVLVGTELGVFDGVIEQIQSSIASSGLIDDGKMDVVSVNGKAYIPTNTVKYVRSALFSSGVIYEGLDRVASVSAGSTFTSSDYGTCTILNDCYAFLYQYGNLSSRRVVLIPFDFKMASAKALVSFADGTSPSTSYKNITGLGNVYYLSIETTNSYVSHLSLNLIKNTSNVGNAVESFFNGEFEYSPKTIVYTDYAVALGNVALDDVDLQTGYPAWYNDSVVVDGSNGFGDDPAEEDDYIVLPIAVPDDPAELKDLTQDDVYVSSDLIVEVPDDSGTVSGSGISETWLGQKLDALGDWLSGIKTSIIEFPQKISALFDESIDAVVTLGEYIINGEWLTGIEVFFSDMYSLWFGDLITGIRTLGDTITTAWDNAVQELSSRIQSIFVPSEDYLTAKVDALRSKFGFIDSIIVTGEFLRDSISGASGPPVIYVDLSLAGGDTNYGSKVLLTDFSWYEQYKPTVDTVLSAALWAFFGWRVFLKLPGIISGESGYLGEMTHHKEKVEKAKAKPDKPLKK